MAAARSPSSPTSTTRLEPCTRRAGRADEAVDGRDGAKVAVVTGAVSGIGAATAAGSRPRGSTWSSAPGGWIGWTRSRTRSAPGRCRSTCRHRLGRGVLRRGARLHAPREQRRRGAQGLAPVAEADEEDWRWMFDANVLGVDAHDQGPAARRSSPAVTATSCSSARSPASSLPRRRRLQRGQVRRAGRGRVLRQELLGQPVRVTEVDPGHGRDRVLASCASTATRPRPPRSTTASTPLTADDVADCIGWAATRPSHVNIDQIVVNRATRPQRPGSTAEPDRPAARLAQKFWGVRRLGRMPPRDLGHRRDGGAERLQAEQGVEADGQAGAVGHLLDREEHAGHER